MVQIENRLGQGKTEVLTQAIETDVIKELEEIVDAFKKAKQRAENQKKPPGPSNGEPQDPPLIEKLAELKMIRSLQMRVNRRTERYGKLIEPGHEQAARDDVLDALRHLGDQQKRVYEITRDMEMGKGEEMKLRKRLQKVIPLKEIDMQTLRLCDRSHRTGLWRCQSSFCNLQFAFCIFQFAILFCLLAALPAVAAPTLQPADPVIRKAPTWHLPPVADVKAQAVEWVRKNCKDPAAQAKALAVIGGIADKADGTELLDRLGEAFAAADPGVAQLVDLCSRPRTRAVLPSFAWMTDPKSAPIVAANMRLYFGAGSCRENGSKRRSTRSAASSRPTSPPQPSCCSTRASPTTAC